MILGNSAQVILGLLDQDKGDEDWYGTWLDMVDAMRERFISFKFKDHHRKKDVAEFVFRNDDYAFTDTPVFTRGQKLIMIWGRPGEMVNPRRMIVHKVKASEQLRVVCHCTLSLLDKEKRARVHHGITDSDYVRIVAEEYGYKGPLLHIDEVKEVRETISQAKWMTDARMLRQLARRNNYQFYIDASGLHWKKKRTDLDPVATFIYKTDTGVGDILDPPEIEADLSRGIAKVRVLARDPFTKQMVVGEAGDDESDMESLGEMNEFGDPNGELGNREKRVTRVDERPGGYMTQEEAQAEAVARYRETAEKRYKMKIRVAGRAFYGAKLIYDIWGVSDTFDGLYYANVCETEIRNNAYFITFHLVKDALREVKATRASERRGRKNKKGGLDKKPKDDGVLPTQWAVRWKPDGTPFPVLIYMDSKGEVASVDESPSWEQLSSLPDDVLGWFAERGAQSVLPDD